MRITLLIFLSIAAHAAVTVRSVDATHAQAIIQYTAPTDSACTLEAWDMDYPIHVFSASGSGSTLTVNTKLRPRRAR